MTDTSSIEVAARDLPLSCPPAGSAVWNPHPPAFLDLARGVRRPARITARATCIEHPAAWKIFAR